MKGKQHNKEYRINIRSKILIGMVVCVLIVTNLIGWFFIAHAKNTMLEQCKNNAKYSAMIAAKKVDGDATGKSFC